MILNRYKPNTNYFNKIKIKFNKNCLIKKCTNKGNFSIAELNRSVLNNTYY